MEVRPYFLLGDLIATSGVGALAASVMAWLGLRSWPMLVAMPAGMVLGMVIGLVAALMILSLLFGAMEIFVSSMLSGMVAGMAGSMGVFDGFRPAAVGALAGLATLILIYIANAALRGSQRLAD